MHNDPAAARHLIQVMTDCARIAERATNKSVRDAAARLRDKAFAQYVWG